jgi:hypothetical protein
MNYSLNILSIAVITLTGLAFRSAAEEIDLQHWAYYQEVALPNSEAEHFDLLVPVSVFDGAREDLGDLRLFDAAGVEIPYALRVRERESTREKIETKRFNEGKGPRGSSELSLELPDQRKGHNRIDVHLTGQNFRRRTTVEGSDDGESWVELANKNLLRFESFDKQDISLLYSSSSYRYLRVRVYQDPEVDDAPVEIRSIEVSRQVDVPGEYVTREAVLSPREAVRSGFEPASAWRIDLGGRRTPIRWLYAEVAESDFSRDYQLQTTTDNRFFPFKTLLGGTWQRRADDEIQPLEIQLSEELRGHRLRLLLADHANPPLNIQRVTYSAPARQIVLANSGKLQSPLRLYYGNPDASLPKYDFGRILPQQLKAAPFRLEIGDRQDNPNYVPPPKALTERWPYLVYVVLSLVCLALAAIIVSIARATIQLADSASPGQSAAT